MSFEELLKKIQYAKDRQMPFVIYRKPEAKEVKVLIQKNRDIEYSQDYQESGFILAPFDASKKAIVFTEKNTEKLSCDLTDAYFSALPEFKVSSNAEEDVLARSRHMNLVKKGINEIKKGSFVKTVLSRSEIFSLNEVDISTVFLRLLRKYPSAFVYVWYHPKVGIWSGASPELLLKTEGVHFQTMSLAGTQKYRDSINVTWGTKEKKEQQIVTDHIVESLEGIQLDVSDTYTRKAGNLLHLCNDIKGELGLNTSLKEIIEKLHPTAAICGFPKEEVRRFILNEEDYDRSYYTGFLGELNRNVTGNSGENKDFKSNLFVNLRCMQLEEKPDPHAIIYVGGGITLESDPLSEWKETMDKSLIMKSVLES